MLMSTLISASLSLVMHAGLVQPGAHEFAVQDERTTMLEQNGPAEFDEIELFEDDGAPGMMGPRHRPRGGHGMQGGPGGPRFAPQAGPFRQHLRERLGQHLRQRMAQRFEQGGQGQFGGPRAGRPGPMGGGGRMGGGFGGGFGGGPRGEMPQGGRRGGPMNNFQGGPGPMGGPGGPRGHAGQGGPGGQPRVFEFRMQGPGGPQQMIERRLELRGGPQEGPGRQKIEIRRGMPLDGPQDDRQAAPRGEGRRERAGHGEPQAKPQGGPGGPNNDRPPRGGRPNPGAGEGGSAGRGPGQGGGATDPQLSRILNMVERLNARLDRIEQQASGKGEQGGERPAPRRGRGGPGGGPQGPEDRGGAAGRE